MQDAVQAALAENHCHRIIAQRSEPPCYNYAAHASVRGENLTARARYISVLVLVASSSFGWTSSIYKVGEGV